MAKNQFDDAASAWDDNPRRMAVTQAVAGAIAEAIPLHPDMNMLDFGCGTGTLSVLLSDRVGRIGCVDTSAGMIAELRRKLAAAPDLDERIEPMHLDSPLDGKLPGGWDLVCSSLVLHHIEDARGAVEQLAGLLTPSGRLALADLYPEDGSFHWAESVPHQGFDPEGLAGLLERLGLVEIEIRKVLTFPKPASDGSLREYAIFLLTAVAT